MSCLDLHRRSSREIARRSSGSFRDGGVTSLKKKEEEEEEEGRKKILSLVCMRV